MMPSTPATSGESAAHRSSRPRRPLSRGRLRTCNGDLTYILSGNASKRARGLGRVRPGGCLWLALPLCVTACVHEAVEVGSGRRGRPPCCVVDFSSSHNFQASVVSRLTRCEPPSLPAANVVVRFGVQPRPSSQSPLPSWVIFAVPTSSIMTRSSLGTGIGVHARSPSMKNTRPPGLPSTRASAALSP
jgi:hypothetical protein